MTIIDFFRGRSPAHDLFDQTQHILDGIEPLETALAVKNISAQALGKYWDLAHDWDKRLRKLDKMIEKYPGVLSEAKRIELVERAIPLRNRLLNERRWITVKYTFAGIPTQSPDRVAQLRPMQQVTEFLVSATTFDAEAFAKQEAYIRRQLQVWQSLVVEVNDFLLANPNVMPLNDKQVLARDCRRISAFYVEKKMLAQPIDVRGMDRAAA